MKSPVVLFAALLIGLASCGTRTDTPQREFATLDSLFKSYHQDNLKLNPLQATSLGDPRYNDQLPNTITQGYRNQARDFYTRYITQLIMFDRATLSEKDQLSYDILKHQCDLNIERLSHKDYLMPITQLGSLPQTMAQLGSASGNQPFKTVTDYDNWLKRVDAFLPWVDSAMANMRKGMATGYVIPKVNAAKIIPQLEAFDHGSATSHSILPADPEAPFRFCRCRHGAIGRRVS